MTSHETHGLAIGEQAAFLWAVCRYSRNLETCPVILLKDLGGCPFQNTPCEDIEPWAWLPILKKRIPPKEAEIDNDVDE